jgi:hypothetical protein
VFLILAPSSVFVAPELNTSTHGRSPMDNGTHAALFPA